MTRRSSFQRGRQNVYACGCCGRQTRGAGDAFGADLCGECYELAGIENAISDRGDEALTSYAVEARRLLALLRTKPGADMTNWNDLTATLDAWDARRTS